MQEPFLSFSTWYEKPPGSWLLKLECEETRQLLTKFRGDCLVQIGGTADMAHSANNRFHRCYRLRTWNDKESPVDIIADLKELPLLPNSVDAIMLIHVFEFIEHPAQFLQEIYQVLSPGGQLFIVGFNPWSLLGMRKLLLRHSNILTTGKFWSRAVVKRWLIEQNYTMIFSKTFCFHWSQQHLPASRLHLFREALGQLCLPKIGNIYLMGAQKRIYHLIKPLKSRWQKQSLRQRAFESARRESCE